MSIFAWDKGQNSTIILPAVYTICSLFFSETTNNLLVVKDWVKPQSEQMLLQRGLGAGRKQSVRQSRLQRSSRTSCGQPILPITSSLQTETTLQPMRIIIIMEQPLYSQVKELLDQKDQQSIKYILSDQPQEIVDSICSKLPERQAAIVRRIYLEIKGECKGVKLEDELQLEIRSKRMEKFLEEGEEKKGESFLQLLSRANEKLRYMEEYGFPYYDLCKRILTTHGDLHPVTPTIKTLHSQVQIMLTVLLREEVLAHSQERFRGLQAGIKNYLQAIFPAETEKYRNAQTLYRNIKKSTKEEHSSDEEDYEPCQQVPLSLDETLMLDEKEFLASLAEVVPFDEFQQFCRNREYNFMCFGIKKFQAFVGLPPTSYALIKEKEFCELVSFLTVRFVRKILFGIIRQRGEGKLLPLTKCITSQQITAVGNELVDQISSKIDEFLAPVKSNEEQAAQLFLAEFQDMNYQDFIPKRYLNQAVRKKVDAGQYVWEQNKEYKTLWLQRVKAERFIREGEKGPKPNLEYIDHIKANYSEFMHCSASLWKGYIMAKFGYKSGLSNSPRKRTKLQSLKD